MKGSKSRLTQLLRKIREKCDLLEQEVLGNVELFDCAFLIPVRKILLLRVLWRIYDVLALFKKQDDDLPF